MLERPCFVDASPEFRKLKDQMIMTNATAQIDIVVLGSTNWDVCMYLSHLPAPGETVGEGRLKTHLGGKGANQAVASWKAHPNTAFISSVGDDATGDTIVAQLQALGLDTSYIHRIANTPTGTACIFIDAQAENCIGLTAGANDALSKDHVEQHANLIDNAKVLLLQLETPLATVEHAARKAKQAQTRVVLNPAPAKALPDSILVNCSVLTPNQGELALLSGVNIHSDEDIVRAAQHLLAKGVEDVVVTLGERGCLWINTKRHQHFAAFNVEALDTTAAGDTFSGFLAAQLAQAHTMEQAIPVAMAAAALSVTREGAIPSIPSHADVTAFMQQHTNKL